MTLHERRRQVDVVHLTGPPAAITRPPREPLPEESESGASTAPIFVVAAFESLARFVACALGQHPRLRTVGVSGWLVQVAQLAARFVQSEREGAAHGRQAPITPAGSVNTST